MAAGMIYVGTVAAVEETGVLVNVPNLAPRAAFGPVPTLVADLAVGERVAVSNLGGTAHALIILGRMAGRPPDVAEIPGLAATLDAHDVRLDAVELDNETDQLVLADHGQRITAAETLNAAQNGRLADVEGVAAGAATAAAAANTAAENASSAVTTLRADTAGKVTTKGDLLIATASGVLARQAVVPTGWMLSGDPASPTGWAARDVLGLSRALTGATAATRFVGATTTGAPTTGTFAVGDWVVDAVTGVKWTCTVAGTPGTWVNAGLSRPIGHTGMTGGFQPCNGAGAYCLFPAAQVLRGGITHNAAQNALVPNKTGLYRITAKGYFTGGTAYQAITYVTRNDTALPPAAGNIIANALTWKADAGDYTGLISEKRTLTAGDLIRLYVQGTSNTYGTDGYNGSYLELEYLDQ